MAHTRYSRYRIQIRQRIWTNMKALWELLASLYFILWPPAKYTISRFVLQWIHVNAVCRIMHKIWCRSRWHNTSNQIHIRPLNQFYLCMLNKQIKHWRPTKRPSHPPTSHHITNKTFINANKIKCKHAVVLCGVCATCPQGKGINYRIEIART